MELNIFDPTHPLDDDLRDYAATRLDSLAAHALPITHAEVEFYRGDIDGRILTQLVSITLTLDLPACSDLKAHAHAPDSRKAFDLAFTHLDQKLLHLADAPPSIPS
jgi:ribosome-associated translation inhibitor RaiA